MAAAAAAQESALMESAQMGHTDKEVTDKTYQHYRFQFGIPRFERDVEKVSRDIETVQEIKADQYGDVDHPDNPLPLIKVEEEDLLQRAINDPATGLIEEVQQSGLQKTDSADFEQYIIRAEKLVPGHVPARGPIFRRAPGVPLPKLVKDVPNRVIIFAGCFNPPHKAHFELLCHTFFRADYNTIAAMLMVGDDSTLTHKDFVNVGNRSLILSKAQRIELWEDGVLGRFTWAWSGRQNDVDVFIAHIQDLAEKDGFALSFTQIFGADHIRALEAGERGWGTGSAITSDISRPVGFMASGVGKPPRVDKAGWSEWRQTLPPTYVPEGKVPHCSQWPCWTCWKMGEVFPEYFTTDFQECK